jgi:hypothetical protein
MKKLCIVIGMLSAVGVAVADEPAAPSMKFTSIPVSEKIGSGEHKLFPYRAEDKIVVIVVDPIACGQKPVKPSFRIEGNKLLLRYELTQAPAGAAGKDCTAHSTFELDRMPHQDLQVNFAGGPEPFVVANMTRCPNAEPVVDVWDCLVPHK